LIPDLRPTRVIVDLDKIRENYREVKRTAASELMPVIKADAYGHGAVRVAEVLQEEGAGIFGVATIEEGIELRNSGIRIPILVLGSVYPFENYRFLIENELTPVIASRISLRELQSAAEGYGKKVSFHLEVDTGMGRTGVAPDTAVELYGLSANLNNVQCEGVFTHLARADEDWKYTLRQIDLFNGFLNRIKEPPRYIHAANTAGILGGAETRFNMARPGLAIYGLYPQSAVRENYNFRPALSWMSKIIFLKEVEKGTPVSYGGTWTAHRRSKIATICVGYADGYPRILSGKSSVIIKNRRCPVVGRVCMDMIMADVSEVPGVDIGDDAALIGKNGGKEEISAEELARLAKTVNYEIVTGIKRRVSRVFKKESRD